MADDTLPEPAPLPKISDRQASFIQEYLVDLSASKAGLRAGYHSASDGARLLKHPGIKARVAQAMQQRQSRTQITQDTVLYETNLLATSRLDWFVIDDEGQVKLTDKAPEGALGAVQSIRRRVRITRNPRTDEVTSQYDVELKFWDKPGSLKLLGQHVGLFREAKEDTQPAREEEDLARLSTDELAARAEMLANRLRGRDPSVH